MLAVHLDAMTGAPVLSELVQDSNMMYLQEEIRSRNLQRALAACTVASSSEQQELGSAEGAITSAEEQLLLRFYGTKVPLLTQQLGLPRKVALTALLFLKRFYLSKSVLEADPARYMLTCIYLACKAEESYISADDFCHAVQQDSASVLQNEVALLQALRFDLVVHQPLWALQGFFADFEAWRGSAATSAPADLETASAAVVQQAHGAAKTALTRVMLTDAPLVHPPGLLALSAMHTGFAQQSLSLEEFVRHVARHAAAGKDTGSDSSGSTIDGLQAALQHQLHSIGELAEDGAKVVSDVQVRDIDRKCKALKKRKALVPKQ